jgi:hypothetical protein
MPGSHAGAWEREICGSGFPAATIVAGKPLPPDNILIKLIKKWKFLYYELTGFPPSRE